MKRPVISRSRSASAQNSERGVTMILVAISMVAIIAMAALSIDVVTLYLARSEAQRAADTAALAAAKVISLSGVTGDPANTTGDWTSACTLATQVAQAVANENAVGGTAASSVTVTFSYNGTTTDCTALPRGFAVNPQVQVRVTRASLPTFFARIWSQNSNTVGASAMAEAFNPSGSDNLLGTIVAVQPRCVKPWVVPNLDPLNSPNGSACTNNCRNFVSPTNGSLQNPGISLNGTNANGVIGERFWLVPDCNGGGGPCEPPIVNPPQANYSTGGFGFSPPLPNLMYVPGEAPTTAPTAVPSCSNPGGVANYEPAISGCDQATVYACGTVNANRVNLFENPGPPTNDTLNGVECLTNATGTGLGQGQDSLNDSAFPFQITAGGNSPLPAAVQGNVITTSTSIVSLPIYNTVNLRRRVTDVTIVGFLQVFINQVDGNGDVDVTVLNVSGCGNGTFTPSATVDGSSPVPVRLITPP